MVYDKKLIKNVFDLYLKKYPNENIAGTVSRLLYSKVSLTSRKNFFGHITCSAIILNQSLTRLLLIKHKVIGKFIQPGGHVDDTDASLLAAVKREIVEETNIFNHIYIPLNKSCQDVPFDIDIHKIPANNKRNEPEHWHFDFRYLFCLVGENEIKIKPTEVTDSEWLPIDKVAKKDASFARTIIKIKELIHGNIDKIFLTR